MGGNPVATVCFPPLSLLLFAATATAQQPPRPPTPPPQGAEHHEPQLDPRTRPVPYDRAAFRNDPHYQDTWNAQEQQDIYGGKHAVPTQRPLLELGRELYREGPLSRGLDWFSADNTLAPHFMVYGDARVAGGYNRVADPASPGNTQEFGVLAPRLNLEFDFKLTATERIHAFVSPFEQPRGDTTFTRAEFGDRNDDDFGLDGNLDALFFEGDLGAMWPGASSFDLPFAFGLMPLLFQNGVWVEDAFTGVAVTVPARHSKALGIANFDVTFFAGFDKVDTGAVAGLGGDDSEADVFGVTAFVEAAEGYFEFGYGFTTGEVRDPAPGALPGSMLDADYHNLTAAFTRRYGGWLSNSVRAIVNAGQDRSVGTADGALLLVENSLITQDPYGFVPYCNLFLGIDTPQSLARAVAAGGVLKNTGLGFEADALTGFPSLDPTGHDAFGGAFGLNWLIDFTEADPSHRRQLVLEVAAARRYHASTDRAGAVRPEATDAALGLRYQMPLNHALVLRLDATHGFLSEDVDYTGLRLELRWKF